jgi:hypothetical protein
MILQDAPPETKVLRIETALRQLREWRFELALRSPVGIREPVTTDVGQEMDNVVYVAPEGWVRENVGGGLVLLKGPYSNERILINKGEPLIERFEDKFDQEVRGLNPITFTTRVTTIPTQEGSGHGSWKG